MGGPDCPARRESLLQGRQSSVHTAAHHPPPPPYFHCNSQGKERIAAMTEEEAAKWREERNARGVARKQERDAGRAKMEKVGGECVCCAPAPAALRCLHLGSAVHLGSLSCSVQKC